MRTRVSPSTGRRYPLTMICAGYRLARSSVYAARPHPTAPRRCAKRGPKAAVSGPWVRGTSSPTLRESGLRSGAIVISLLEGALARR